MPRRRALAGLLMLALCAGAADAARKKAAPEAAGRPARVGRALQRMDLQDLLGRERWRQLEEARFRIHLHDLAFTPNLKDLPSARAEVGRVLVRSLLKGSQEAVERRLRLEERRDALRDRLRGHQRIEDDPARARLTASPRFHLHRELWAGAKLRLRGTGSAFWEHADLRVGSELDGGNPSLKLAFQDDRRHGFVSYHFAHPQWGEAIELRIGLSF